MASGGFVNDVLMRVMTGAAASVIRSCQNTTEIDHMYIYRMCK